jgi:hypothetical protein
VIYASLALYLIGTWLVLTAMLAVARIGAKAAAPENPLRQDMILASGLAVVLAFASMISGERTPAALPNSLVNGASAWAGAFAAARLARRGRPEPVLLLQSFLTVFFLAGLAWLVRALPFLLG